MRNTLVFDGVDIKNAGARGQDYDLEIFSKLKCDPYLSIHGLTAGKYEIKSLWRKNDNCKFDRRFKAGRRGERIYGKRDAQIKSFALALENEIDDIIDNSVLEEHSIRDGEWVTNFVNETHDFINQALERKHSKKFEERIMRLAKASLAIPKLRLQAAAILTEPVNSSNIIAGFDNIEGIFVVADRHYTLINKAEMPKFLIFDSASSEGPKIRYQGCILGEP